MAINGFNGKYRFLSNFYPTEFDYAGIADWPSSEHAYQAMKTVDESLREQIHDLPTPGAAKKAGKKVSLRPNWNQIKLNVMLNILRAKFAEDTLLAAQLLDTGDEELIEENWWGDRYWGTCNGIGENHLGKLLMQVRAELRQ